MIKGYVGAALEVFFFGILAHIIRGVVPGFKSVDLLTYYWFSFTVLTGFWESVYITHYDTISSNAQVLIRKNQHVWTNFYGLEMIIPSQFSKLFYAEYGAWADREYMSRKADDYWSRLIESSHALFCAGFSLTALLFKAAGHHDKFLTAAGIAMGCQFMNSLLYMGEYYLQCRDPDNVNDVTSSFCMGPWMYKRFFMWVNVFWLVMPSYICATLLGVHLPYVAFLIVGTLGMYIGIPKGNGSHHDQTESREPTKLPM